MNERRLLAIFAHPDDETYRAGGTLALLARRGVRVWVLCATRGEAGVPGLAPEQAGQPGVLLPIKDPIAAWKMLVACRAKQVCLCLLCQNNINRQREHRLFCYINNLETSIF